MNPHLAHIRIFPVKSLDGQEVAEAAVLRSGALAHDREFCLLDNQGAILNGKRAGGPILQIRSEVSLGYGEIRLNSGGRSVTYRLGRDEAKMERWLKRRLRKQLRLVRNTERGFPDDTEAAGPTLISTATLAEVADWFGIGLEEARRRFRSNLEIEGVEAFWEDRLYGPAGETVRFRIGDVAIEGVKPCARCTVPSRDSRTGEVLNTGFQKIFATRRRKTLPGWAERSRFDHFYRLAVNTKIPESEAGKTLHQMDEVVL